MLVIFPIIFGFYVLWELSKLIELWKKNGPRLTKYLKWNIIFLILFLIQLAVYSYFANLSGLVWFQCVFWIASMTMIIVYRIDRLRDWVMKDGVANTSSNSSDLS
jgi:hypothetical protein